MVPYYNTAKTVYPEVYLYPCIFMKNLMYFSILFLSILFQTCISQISLTRVLSIVVYLNSNKKYLVENNYSILATVNVCDWIFLICWKIVVTCIFFITKLLTIITFFRYFNILLRSTIFCFDFLKKIPYVCLEKCVYLEFFPHSWEVHYRQVLVT